MSLTPTPGSVQSNLPNGTVNGHVNGHVNGTNGSDRPASETQGTKRKRAATAGVEATPSKEQPRPPLNGRGHSYVNGFINSHTPTPATASPSQNNERAQYFDATPNEIILDTTTSNHPPSKRGRRANTPRKDELLVRLRYDEPSVLSRSDISEIVASSVGALKHELKHELIQGLASHLRDAAQHISTVSANIIVQRSLESFRDTGREIVGNLRWEMDRREREGGPRGGNGINVNGTNGTPWDVERDKREEERWREMEHRVNQCQMTQGRVEAKLDMLVQRIEEGFGQSRGFGSEILSEIRSQDAKEPRVLQSMGPDGREARVPGPREEAEDKKVPASPVDTNAR